MIRARVFPLIPVSALKPLCLALCLAEGNALAADLPDLGNIEVTAPRTVLPALDAASMSPAAGVPDLAQALAEQPGMAVVRNGALTGIAQVRGVSGDRVNILVDGMEITPACPNHMDPPLHYASSAEIAALDHVAGTSSVAAGGDALGASVIARPNRPDFSESLRGRGQVDAGYSGANEGWNLALQAELAGARHALAYQGSAAEADDLRFPGGRVDTSGYSLQRHALRYAHALNDGHAGRFDLAVSQHRTRDAGTPALPMDMIEDDATGVNAALETRLGKTRLSARIYRHDIDHLMDNYSLRPNAGTRMFAPAASQDTGVTLDVRHPVGRGEWRAGAEWRGNDFDAYQWNASANAFNADILRNAERNRLGVYSEWQGPLGGAWRGSFGLRSDTVDMSAGRVRSGAAQAEASTGLGGAFNAADRDKTDHNLDWNAVLQVAAAPGLDYELGLARKTRSPSLLERYEWTPLNASAGQADNNSYYGNLALKPEVAHGVNLSARLRRGAHALRLSGHYQRVHDFIVGTPIANPTGAANFVLQYQNHDALLYGLEAEWIWRASPWRVDAAASLTRGRNQDTGGNLYRVAPASLRLGIERESGAWKNRLSLRAADGQTHLADYNRTGLTDELATPGYAVLDWQTRWQASKAVNLRLGVDNLLDKSYYDHLGGINRVSGSDVAVGARLPGAGRFAYVQLQWML